MTRMGNLIMPMALHNTTWNCPDNFVQGSMSMDTKKSAYHARGHDSLAGRKCNPQGASDAL